MQSVNHEYGNDNWMRGSRGFGYASVGLAISALCLGAWGIWKISSLDSSKENDPVATPLKGRANFPISPDLSFNEAFISVEVGEGTIDEETPPKLRAGYSTPACRYQTISDEELEEIKRQRAVLQSPSSPYTVSMEPVASPGLDRFIEICRSYPTGEETIIDECFKLKPNSRRLLFNGIQKAIKMRFPAISVKDLGDLVVEILSNPISNNGILEEGFVQAKQLQIFQQLEYHNQSQKFSLTYYPKMKTLY